MAKYDDVSWHYEGEYPLGLEDECAATHIGMFLRWCIEQQFYSSELLADAEEEIEEVLAGDRTGGEFLLDVCDEKFVTDDLSNLGNAFASDYYIDNTAFAKAYAWFEEDYLRVFGHKAQQVDMTLASIYNVADTEANYQLIKVVLDQRYQQWLRYKRK